MKINFNGRFLVFSLFCSILSAKANAQQIQQGHPSGILQLDPAVRTGKLGNGFSYYLRNNTTEKGRAVLYLVNKVGSILEEDRQQGLAHFMEHMNFNGTVSFPGNKMVDYLEKSGVRFGADLNAYTGYDETVYQLPIQFDTPELISGGLQVLRDWAKGALLDPIEIDKERGVILEEKRSRSGLGQRMQDAVMPVLLNKSRYTSRSPIGSESVLKTFTPADLRAFYDDWYRPDLQSLIIVGDFNVDSIEAVVQKKFGDLRSPLAPKMRTDYSVPLNGKNQFLAVWDKENSQTTIKVFIKHRASLNRTKAEYREMLVRNIFNMLTQDRFAELSQKPHPQFIGAYAAVDHLLADVDAFNASVTVNPGQLESGFKAMWTQVSQIRTSGFTAAELSRAKYAIERSMQASAANLGKVPSAQYVQEYTRLILNGEAAPGITGELALVKELLPGISLSDLDRFAKQSISATNRDVIIEGTQADSAGFPDEVTIDSWMDAAQKLSAGAPAADTDSAVLMREKPLPGKIISEKMIGSLGVTELTFSNGLRAVLKPTEFKNDEILFNAFSNGGTSLYSDAEYESAANAADIISDNGVGTLNPIALRNLLNGKQVGVRPFISELTQGVSGMAAKDDLETALQLTSLYFTAPRQDSVLFQVAIDRARAQLSGAVSTPMKVFADTINSVINGKNVRKSPPSLAKLSQIDFQKTFRIYRERFADASGFTFVLAGNFDTMTIRPLLEQYLGSLPTLHRNEDARETGAGLPVGKHSRTVYSGSEDKAVVQLLLSGKYKYAQANNIELKALKEILDFRLTERLRETEGGVYTPSVGLSLENSKRGASYKININFTCSVENVEKLIAASWEEIEKLKTDGPPSGDVEKFKVEETIGLKNAMQTNGFWTGYLNSSYRGGTDPVQILEYPKQVGQLTGEKLKAAARNYLDGKNYIRFVLLPEKIAVMKSHGN